MVDYEHLDNIIQREVINVEERTPEDQQDEALQALLDFLSDQIRRVTITRMKLRERRSEP